MIVLWLRPGIEALSPTGFCLILVCYLSEKTHKDPL